MKIVCPKCLSAYRVDLPDSGGAGIDVQCGQCLHIFLFTQDIEEPDLLEIQSDHSAKIWDSEPPDQPLHSEQTPYSPEKNLETSREWKPKPIPDDPESMEIVVEDEIPEDSLEKEALDDIWNQAVQEGARSIAESKETAPEEPVAEAKDEGPSDAAPPENKSHSLPTLNERQREIDQIIKEHRASLEEFEGSETSLSQKAPKPEKTQEDIDLEEQVTIDEEEAIPNWEDAFAHQAEVEAGWNKAQELDRIQEEQQLAEALGETIEPIQKETGTQEDKQSLVDEIFAEVKGSQKPQKKTAESPQSKPEVDSKQSEVDQIFAEAKAQQEKIQEEIDLNEEVVINEDEDMPSWEDAFAHQAKVEEGWRKAKEQDRIQEEQQLAEALGEDYVPPEPAISESPVVAENPQALVDDIFAQIKSQAQSTDQPPSQDTPAPFAENVGTSSEKTSEPSWTDNFDGPSQVEDSSEASPAPEEKEVSPPPTASDTDLETDLVDKDMKRLVEEAFREESEHTDEVSVTEEIETPEPELFLEEEPGETQEISAEEEIETPILEEVSLEEESEQIAEAPIAEDLEPLTLEETAPEPELSLEEDAAQETLADEQTAFASQDEEDIGQTIDYYASFLDDTGTPQEPDAMDSIPELTLEPVDEEPVQELEETVAQELDEMDSIPELTLESADEEPVQEPEETVAQEEVLEEDNAIWIDAFADPSEIEDTVEIPEEVESTLDIDEPTAEIEVTEPVAVDSDTELTTEFQETLSEELSDEPESTLGIDEPPAEIEVTEPVAVESETELTTDLQETAAFSEETPEEAESTLDIDVPPAETEITEPLAVESEPEPIMETHEATALYEEPLGIEPDTTMESETEFPAELQETAALSEDQPAVPQESSFNEEGEELWEDLLTEHKEERQLADEEISVDSDEEEEPFGGSDFWDQVLEKDSQESPTAETGEEQPVASAPVTQDSTQREAMTDEELWKQAFPGEEELAPAAQHVEEEEKEVPPLMIGANLNEGSEDSLKYDESAYADYDDDDDDFEFQRKKRNLGPFSIPHGRRGDLVIGGVMVVFLLIAGSIYFTLQTFAPGELTDIQTAKTEVPEGLSPREVPLDELAGGLTSPKPPEQGKIPAIETPGDKGEAILSDPEKILEESPQEKGILKDLAESQILKDTGKTQTAKIDQSALQPLTTHSVTMNTIMPVAYNPTDIRVLSFSLEMQLSNAQSANLVRESLPVYEEIVNQTVEDFLQRKFYNDILYVKEKLQKRLQTAMNKSLKTGRVRKAKFVDYAIQ